MVMATIFFWMGRNEFAHIPAKGSSILNELVSSDGILTMEITTASVLFVGMFWCLFDQTASSKWFSGRKNGP